MGHTAFKNLIDLIEELEIIRSFEGIKEKKPGIFYLKSSSFLHFHDSDGKRWADVKLKSGWKKVDIDFSASLSQRKKFIDQVKYHYEEIYKGS